jgi:hypothetical protein
VKKAAIVILALLYILTTSGVVVNVHYCMGAVASVSYGQSEPESCGKCGMTEKAGCCHSEFKVVKLDDEHQQVIKAKQAANYIAEIPVAYFQTVVEIYNSRKDFSTSYHSPPDPRVNSVYLHTNVFRI